MVLYLRELSYTHMNVSGSFQAGIFAGFEWGTVTKWCDVTFSHISSHSRFEVTLPGVEKVCFSTSKNVTIFLELGTNVTISSHRHIIFLGSAWNKTQFQNLARSWVLGSRFSNSGLERPSKPGQVLGSGFQGFQFWLGTTLIYVCKSFSRVPGELFQKLARKMAKMHFCYG